MELEAGMYVRTQNGIGIIKNYLSDYYEIHYPHNIVELLFHHEILNANINRLNVLEMGDKVNGEYIDNISLGRGNYIFCGLDRVYDKDIKSIVTREQFESVSYKLGKED